MVAHLGHALRELRKAHKVRLIEIAYPLRKSEASMSRFEGGRVQPVDLDAVVNAYATELGLEPLEIWAEALRLWREATTPAAERPARELGDAVEGRDEQRSTRGRSAARKKRAAS